MKNRIRKNNRGMVLVAVLLCLGIVTTIMLTVLTTSLRMRRQCQQELAVEQARWVLTAGCLQMSNQKLNAPEMEDRKLVDGTFELKPDLPNHRTATIRRKLISGEAKKENSLVQITVELSDSNGKALVTRSKTIREN